MKWAVYWQPGDDIEVVFYRDESAARDKVAALITECEDAREEEGRPYWDITLLQVRGEVREMPWDGDLKLTAVDFERSSSDNSLMGGVR